MQILIGILLIVAGLALAGAGVGVLCWHDYDDEPRGNGADGSYMGYVTQHLLDRNAEGYDD